jgi:predicted ester cyclase
MSTEDVARSYFDAAAARDADGMASHWSADGVEDLVPIGILRGPDEVRGFFTELFTALPDFEFVVERITAGDRVAAVQWRASGTFEGGPFQGVDPTGRRVELRGCDCVEVEDGLLGQHGVRPLDRHDAAARLAGRAGHEDGLQQLHQTPRRAAISSRAAMQVFVVLTTGLVFWISAWAFGIKSFDAFMVTIALLVGSITVYVFKPYVDRMLGRE